MGVAPLEGRGEPTAESLVFEGVVGIGDAAASSSTFGSERVAEDSKNPRYTPSNSSAAAAKNLLLKIERTSVKRRIPHIGPH
jgi:hypothetical protein